MSEEMFDIVDKTGKVIGIERRSVVHKTGLMHRSAGILLFNSKGQIFLQQRSKIKDICPLKWDMTIEHLKVGETFEDAAIRGLKEELGIESAKVKQVTQPVLFEDVYEDGTRDKELSVLFESIYDGKIVLDDVEVGDGKFFEIEEINKLIKENSSMFTPWFIREWEEVSNRYSKSF